MRRDEAEEAEDDASSPAPSPSPLPSNSSQSTEDSDIDKYIPIFVLTAVFGAMFAFGPLFVRKGPNRQFTRVCIMVAAFCMYSFWVTAYISQMNPLTGPRLHNTTWAWYQYKFGKTVADPKEYSKADTFKLEEELDLYIDDIDGSTEAELGSVLPYNDRRARTFTQAEREPERRSDSEKSG